MNTHATTAFEYGVRPEHAIRVCAVLGIPVVPTKERFFGSNPTKNLWWTGRELMCGDGVDGWKILHEVGHYLVAERRGWRNFGYEAGDKGNFVEEVSACHINLALMSWLGVRESDLLEHAGTLNFYDELECFCDGGCREERRVLRNLIADGEAALEQRGVDKARIQACR